MQFKYTCHGTEIAKVTPNISIYWLFGRKQVYFPPWEQLFPLALPSKIVSLSRDNELDIVLIASKQVYNMWLKQIQFCDMLNNELEGTFHDPKKTIAESKVYFVNIFFFF